MENANLSTIFISFGLNGGLITVAGFFIKKYLDRLEERGNANAEGVAEAKKKAAEELARVTEHTAVTLEKYNAKITRELKEAIHENKMEYKEQSLEIIRRLDDVNAHMVIANGRTAKNEIAIVRVEGAVKTQIALCKQRNFGRRATDHCESVIEDEA